MQLAQTPIRIGSVELPNRTFLAPMSGVSDLPFRRIALRYGAGLVVSEMVAGDSAARGSEEARLRAEGAGLPIHVVQLAGSCPEDMTIGVKIAEAAGAHMIDINMGCPAKRVISGFSGSALMRDLDHALRLIDATIEAANVPVTLKMRLGWDDQSINAPELAKRAEGAGVAMVTVHGRTRCQFYKGKADWCKIKDVSQAISIPLVANGDLTDPKDAQSMLDLSGADAIMVGRGAYGRPWITGQIAAHLAGQSVPDAPRDGALLDLIAEHYEETLQLYGTGRGVRIARKHLGWYLDQSDLAVSTGDRTIIMTSDDPAPVFAALQRLRTPVETQIAA